MQYHDKRVAQVRTLARMAAELLREGGGISVNIELAEWGFRRVVLGTTSKKENRPRCAAVFLQCNMNEREGSKTGGKRHKESSRKKGLSASR